MNYLWKPSNKIVENSNLNKFSKFIGIEFKEDFKKLWEWSVNNPEVFWSKIWDFTKIIGDKGTEILREN